MRQRTSDSLMSQLGQDERVGEGGVPWGISVVDGPGKPDAELPRISDALEALHQQNIGLTSNLSYKYLIQIALLA